LLVNRCIVAHDAAPQLELNPKGVP
jgi:hypothetical protein